MIRVHQSDMQSVNAKIMSQRNRDLKGNIMFFKKKNNRFGKYPSCDMLNHAIRFLLDGKTEAAIIEIIYAIEKADGYFHEDLKKAIQDAKDNYWKDKHN